MTISEDECQLLRILAVGENLVYKTVEDRLIVHTGVGEGSIGDRVTIQLLVRTAHEKKLICLPEGKALKTSIPSDTRLTLSSRGLECLKSCHKSTSLPITVRVDAAVQGTANMDENPG